MRIHVIKFCALLIAVTSSCGVKMSTTVVGTSLENSLSGFKVDNLSSEVIAGQLITGSCPTGSFIEASSTTLAQNPTQIFCVNNTFTFTMNLKPDLPPSGSAPISFSVKNIHGSLIETKTATVTWDPVIETAPITSSSSSSNISTSSSSESSQTSYVPPTTINSLSCSCNETGCNISATCSGTGSVSGTMAANPYWSLPQANVPIFVSTFSSTCVSGNYTAFMPVPDFDKDLARIDRNNGAMMVLRLGGRSTSCGYLNACGTLTPDNSHYCRELPPIEETTPNCSCDLDETTEDRCREFTALFRTNNWKANYCNSSSSSDESSSESSESSWSSEDSSSSSSESSWSSEDSSSSSSESSWSSEDSSSSESSWSSEESSSSESSWSSEDISSSSSNQSNPTSYQVVLLSRMYSDSSCTQEVTDANIVLVSHVGQNHIGSYGTTQTYTPGDWVTWEWTFSPIWDFRTSQDPTGSAYYKDQNNACQRSFNASANFSGRVVQ